MSSGETEFRSPGIPSMSTKGLELAFKVVIPRKAICEVEVGLASGVMILRPGIFPFDQLCGIRSRCFYEIIGFDCGNGTGHFPFLLRTVTDNYHFIDLLGVFDQYDVGRFVVIDNDFFCSGSRCKKFARWLLVELPRCISH